MWDAVLPAPFLLLDRTAALALRQPDARLSRVTRIRNAAMLNEPTVAAANQNSKSVRLGTTPASLRVAEGWYVGGAIADRQGPRVRMSLDGSVWAGRHRRGSGSSCTDISEVDAQLLFVLQSPLSHSPARSPLCKAGEAESASCSWGVQGRTGCLERAGDSQLCLPGTRRGAHSAVAAWHSPRGTGEECEWRTRAARAVVQPQSRKILLSLPHQIRRRARQKVH
ncbi:uncharacterized protein LOC129783798 isoform X1 [Falco peregrinus]|uniref:uncharacterized protein LOC129783798 isoform X1 n=1 Tax=Falco peregrinus TaxID=8954 RepID=UPI00247A44B3|nr:uncharacterized protein LOC129783798 isoform X1 [Falco peregrinus]